MSNATAEPRSFTQAARAAEDLVAQLESYKSSVDELAALRSDIGGLRAQLAATVEPTAALASSARAAAATFDAVDAARPHVESLLSDLTASASHAAASLGTTVASASGAAAAQIGDAARAGTASVRASVATLDQALADVDAAAMQLSARIQNEGSAGTEALLAELASATEQVQRASAAAVSGLVQPAQQAGAAVTAAQSAATALRDDLDAATLKTKETAQGVRIDLAASAAETRDALRGSVAETRAQLRDQLALADAEFRQTRARDLSRLVQLAWATLAAVLVFGIAAVAGAGCDAGAPLADSTVQVLNGVDPDASYGEEVAERVRLLGRGEVQAVMYGDAATTRQARTLILVHGASMSAGRTLARLLGLNETRVVEASPLPLAGQLTILIGADFREAFTLDPTAQP